MTTLVSGVSRPIKQFYRVDEVVVLLRVSRRTVYRRCADGTIPSLVIRGVVRIPVREFHLKFGGEPTR